MTPREVIALTLRTGSGRVGMGFLIILVLVSLFVLIKFPSDFGPTRWNNPSEWANNPKAVPPMWAALFDGDQHVKHTAMRVHEPSVAISNALTERRTYNFDYQFSEGRLPTFLAFTVSNVRYWSRPPVISLHVQRPDGSAGVIRQEVIRGPRSGEESPYVRYQDTPFRLGLSSDRGVMAGLTQFFNEEYGVVLASSDLQDTIETAMFGVPSADGSKFSPLVGTYRFSVRLDMNEQQDTVDDVQFIFGGSVYGAMGTDSLGRDLALGLLFGAPVALTIGVVTSLFTTVLGTTMGIVSGFSGGKTDILIQRFADVWSNIPLLPVLIFLVFILGQRLWIVVLIMIVFGWPGLAIVVRSMVLQMRTGQLVEATRAIGASNKRIMFRHLLVQVAPFVFAQMIFFTPAAILAEAGLSFLGLGDPSIPTWGQILEHGFRTGAVYIGYWWWVLPPGLLIVATAMTFVLLTLGLEPVVNPRLRKT